MLISHLFLKENRAANISEHRPQPGSATLGGTPCDSLKKLGLQVDARSKNVDFSIVLIGFLGHQVGTEWAPKAKMLILDPSKTPPRRPKTPQDGPRRSQDTPKTPPKPKLQKSIGFKIFFWSPRLSHQVPKAKMLIFHWF